MIGIGATEPVDGGNVGDEPVIGWRLWRLSNDRLFSLAKDALWEPGENQAHCLAGFKHEVPATSCHCGFWALNNPVPIMHLAVSYPRSAVGLIRGFGAVAIHGREGFRASHASVVCIFNDAPVPPTTELGNARGRVAQEFGVPCIALDRAISIGFLEEMGVGSEVIEQLKAWMAAGRPLPHSKPALSSIPIRPRRTEEATELTRRELEIALLVAQGLTNMEIAQSIGLNSGAVDFHLYKVGVKTGSKTRANLARWVVKHDG